MNNPSDTQIASDIIEHVANGIDKAFMFSSELATALGTTGAKGLDIAGHTAAVLGTGAAHLTVEAWNVLVNQQIANGVTTLFRWALGWGTLYLLRRAAASAESKYGGFTREKGPTRATWLVALCGLMFCAQVAVGYLEVPLALRQVFNPRYYAAVELVQAVRLLK